ncbi:hypothetical protein MCC01970_11950 [Bifidobacteriaceae bacterium MCC01970]|nr:hypothetical protein MCC01970_11950 [Bifidobacteriaceae bacterium MCC01970]
MSQNEDLVIVFEQRIGDEHIEIAEDEVAVAITPESRFLEIFGE